MAKKATQETEAQDERAAKKIRVTLDLSPDFHARLESLEGKTYLGNKAAVIRHALMVYESLVDLAKEGSEIVIRTPNGEHRRVDRVMLAVAG
jgi:hypothetical protein